MERWVERERRTARLIRACYEHLVDTHQPSADHLYALCKLTWITKGGTDDLPDNTAAVIAPAMSLLVGAEISATTPGELVAELRRHGVDEAITQPAARRVGFTNFYSGFRNIAQTWITQHVDQVSDAVHLVATATSDDAILAAYSALDELPLLPRPRAGGMPAHALLTPALACLDPRGRAPIINARVAVQRRLRRLGLSHATLQQRCAGLLQLIGQAGIDDAFALDTADDEVIAEAIKAETHTKYTGSHTKPLKERRDDDVEYLREADLVTMRHRHHAMTNALRTVCKTGGLSVEEGSDQTCLFDARVRQYAGNERHLLVEVKTDDSAPMARMAVGQLLDYRRQLEERVLTDLAVLFPTRPRKETRDFLGYAGVKVVWFNGDMTKLEGDVEFRLQTVRRHGP